MAAVAAEQEWIESLLERLVEVPSTLGDEEPAQVVVADALRELGLEPVDVPMDAEALRAQPARRPVRLGRRREAQRRRDLAARRARAAAR